MKSIFFRREGQIAPFMIAIIVVLIMALMVTANIGKIGLTKTRTANAADAAALAGSTMYANTLNSLADTNTAMIAEYLSAEISFLIPLPLCKEWVRYIAFLAFVASQTAQFALAWSNAAKGYESARSVALEFSFMNAGIDESKERLSGESYEAYLQRESSFGNWMKDKGYESGQYAWTDKTGKQNSFGVKVDAPNPPGLIPLPMILVGTYWHWIGACDPEEGCEPCVTDTLIFFECLTKARANPTTYVLSQTPTTCFTFAWTLIAYPVPIAYIGGITEDNPRIAVTATRTEPNADLGIWQMKYGDISSDANAEAKGGAIGPVPDPSYESYLISGGIK